MNAQIKDEGFNQENNLRDISSQATINKIKWKKLWLQTDHFLSFWLKNQSYIVLEIQRALRSSIFEVQK